MPHPVELGLTAKVLQLRVQLRRQRRRLQQALDAGVPERCRHCRCLDAALVQVHHPAGEASGLAVCSSVWGGGTQATQVIAILQPLAIGNSRFAKWESSCHVSSRRVARRM